MQLHRISTDFIVNETKIKTIKEEELGSTTQRFYRLYCHRSEVNNDVTKNCYTNILLV